MVQLDRGAQRDFGKRRHVGADFGEIGASGQVAGERMQEDAATQGTQRRRERAQDRRRRRPRRPRLPRCPGERRVQRRRELRALVGAHGQHGASHSGCRRGRRARSRAFGIEFGDSGWDRCVALAQRRALSSRPERMAHGCDSCGYNAAAAPLCLPCALPSRAPGAFSSALVRSVRIGASSAPSRCSRARCCSFASSSFRTWSPIAAGSRRRSPCSSDIRSRSPH